ncbi:hypothetical protein ES703_59191 [subsurface metagenome]
MRVNQLSIAAEFTARDVAFAGYCNYLPVNVQTLHGHLVQRQCPRFIRADNGGRAEGLHGHQFADDGIASGHNAHAHRQYHGDHGGQALRNGGNGCRHRQQEDLQPVQPLEQTYHHQQGTYDEEKNNNVPAQLADVFLKRCLLRLDFLDGGGDLADIRCHASPDGHRRGPAVIDDGAHVHHILSLRHGNVFTDGIGGLVDRHGLAGKHGFIDF